MDVVAAVPLVVQPPHDASSLLTPSKQETCPVKNNLYPTELYNKSETNPYNRKHSAPEVSNSSPIIWNSENNCQDLSIGDQLLPNVHCESNKRIIAIIKKSTSPRKSNSRDLNQPNGHRTLIAQRSSPILNKNSLKKISVVHSKTSSRLKSSKKFPLISPQSKYNHSFSSVPKSDSAYSEDSYSYLPYSLDYSPVSCKSSSSDFPYSYSKLPISEDSFLDLKLSYSSAIPRSDSAYSDQCGISSPQQKISGIPKSSSTFLRSDSAYSDIEYSYSTIPRSDYHLDKDYSCSLLPKSESTCSENFFSTGENRCSSLIPRSISTYSHKLNSYKFKENCSPQSESGNNYSSTYDLNEIFEENSPKKNCIDSYVYSKDNNSLTSTHLVIPEQSSTNMPSLKSFLRQPILGLNNKNENNDKSRKISDISVHSMMLIGKSPSPQIKKSQTVLALSSAVKNASNTASTKVVLSDSERETDTAHCSSNACLTRTLRTSISQTLNKSVGHSLNLLGVGGYANEDTSNEFKRKSHHFLPSSLSLGRSISSKVEFEGGDCNTFYCKICLTDIPMYGVVQLSACQCRFCSNCLTSYTQNQVKSGQWKIQCPDASCAMEEGAELTDDEIEDFAGTELLRIRNNFRLNADISNDPFKVWCPRPGCETIVDLDYPKYLMPTHSRRGTHSNAIPGGKPHVKINSKANLDTGHISQNLISNFNYTQNKNKHRRPLSKGSVQSMDIVVENPNLEEKLSDSQITIDVNSKVNDDCKILIPNDDHEELNINANPIRNGNSNPVKPTVLPLHSNITEDIVKTSPVDSLLVASLTGLQSPADYRPFAQISSTKPVHSPPEVYYQPNPDDPNNLPGTIVIKDDYNQLSIHFPICPKCDTEFCPLCMQDCHPERNCPPQKFGKTKRTKLQSKRLKNTLLSSDFHGVIKSCPKAHCQVPIERNEGCAQMQCRNCKHTFCWYCLASLEDDFLLRHYDKGPCRNKLGHSRASVLCHRLQVMTIFVGIGLLVLAASPLLVVLAPCIVCSRIRAKNREVREYKMEGRR